MPKVPLGHLLSRVAKLPPKGKSVAQLTANADGDAQKNEITKRKNEQKDRLLQQLNPDAYSDGERLPSYFLMQTSSEATMVKKQRAKGISDKGCSESSGQGQLAPVV